MNDMLKLCLSLSLSGSILILVLFLCRPLFKSNMSKVWQYYIWLIVIARLLLPFAPEHSLVGNFLETMTALFYDQKDQGCPDYILCRKQEMKLLQMISPLTPQQKRRAISRCGSYKAVF